MAAAIDSLVHEYARRYSARDVEGVVNGDPNTDAHTPSVAVNEHHRQQHPLPLLGEPPGHQRALLGPVAADRENDRVHKQRRQPEVVEVAAFERLKALAQLRTDARRGRLRQLPQPGLLAQRLDVAHRQPRTKAPITIARSPGAVVADRLIEGL